MYLIGVDVCLWWVYVGDFDVFAVDVLGSCGLAVLRVWVLFYGLLVMCCGAMLGCYGGLGLFVLVVFVAGLPGGFRVVCLLLYCRLVLDC